jgi:glycosyltransferase involved in cell wall biosynthesis
MDSLIEPGESVPAEQSSPIAAPGGESAEATEDESAPTFRPQVRYSHLSDASCNDDIQPCLSVVMPVYNEVATVADMVKTVLNQRPVKQLVIVDDASNDGTKEVLGHIAGGDNRVTVVSHGRNLGKGAALRTGFAHITAPIVIVQDADAEYDPTEYYLVLNPILTGKADVVFGSRFLGAGSRRVLYYWHAVGNRLLTTLSNMATNLNLSDMETRYKVFRQEVAQKINIQENRFGFEPEITAKVSRLKLRIFEVAISYNGRTYAEGKKVGWRDGMHALWCILKYNFLT